MYYSLKLDPLEITLEPLLFGSFYLAIYLNGRVVQKIEITTKTANDILQNNKFEEVLV